MFNKRVIVNASSSAFQVLLVGLIYYLLYKWLLKYLKIEVVGIWSMVLAVTSITNLANFGIASSIVRFVAIYEAEGNFEKIRKLIFTSLIFIGVLFLFISFLAYPVVSIILKEILDSKSYDLAISILPYSLACLIINGFVGVFSSVLDGFQRNYIRNIIMTMSSFVLLIAAFILVPNLGIKGIAISQIIQSFLSLILCLIFVIREISFSLIKWNWDKVVFREIFSYGIKFQVISITSMSFDPITKILLAKFGNLVFVGYYEMANRLVMQVRGAIVNANSSLVPVIAGILEKGKNTVSSAVEFYRKTFEIIFILSITCMSLICVWANVISFYWIGHVESIFVYLLIILCISFLCNLLNGPAYFNCIASGDLNLPIKQGALTFVLNVALGFILGYFFRGYGVVIGWGLAVIISSVSLIMDYNKLVSIKFNMYFNSLVLKQYWGYYVIFLAAVLAFKILINELSFKIELIYILILTISMIIASLRMIVKNILNIY